MDQVRIVLLVLALVLFLLAGLSVPSGRVSLGWIGLACWVATQIPGLVR